MVHSSMSVVAEKWTTQYFHISPIPSTQGEENRLRHTNAVESVLGRFVTRVTGALVAADHVDTLAVPAQPVT